MKLHPSHRLLLAGSLAAFLFSASHASAQRTIAGGGERTFASSRSAPVNEFATYSAGSENSQNILQDQSGAVLKERPVNMNSYGDYVYAPQYTIWNSNPFSMTVTYTTDEFDGNDLTTTSDTVVIQPGSEISLPKSGYTRITGADVAWGEDDYLPEPDAETLKRMQEQPGRWDNGDYNGSDWTDSESMRRRNEKNPPKPIEMKGDKKKNDPAQKKQKKDSKGSKNQSKSSESRAFEPYYPAITVIPTFEPGSNSPTFPPTTYYYAAPEPSPAPVQTYTGTSKPSGGSTITSDVLLQALGLKPSTSGPTGYQNINGPTGYMPAGYFR